MGRSYHNKLWNCMELSVPKNVATKEAVDLHFITLIGAADYCYWNNFTGFLLQQLDFMHTSDILRL